MRSAMCEATWKGVMVLHLHVNLNANDDDDVYIYSKCSKLSNTFLFLFSNKMLVFRTENHKMLVRITNREDPDQKQFELGLCCLSMPFLAGNYCLKF